MILSASICVEESPRLQWPIPPKFYALSEAALRAETRAKRMLQAEVVHLPACLTHIPQWNPQLLQAFTYQAAHDFEPSSFASDV